MGTSKISSKGKIRPDATKQSEPLTRFRVTGNRNGAHVPQRHIAVAPGPEHHAQLSHVQANQEDPDEENEDDNQAAQPGQRLVQRNGERQGPEKQRKGDPEASTLLTRCATSTASTVISDPRW